MNMLKKVTLAVNNQHLLGGSYEAKAEVNMVISFFILEETIRLLR